MKENGWFFRSIATLLVLAQVFSVPVYAGGKDKKPAPSAPPKVKVNRTVPRVAPPPGEPVFSVSPTDAEIFRARVFDEPLVPIGGASTVAENQALAKALLAYLRAGKAEDPSPLESFLGDHPGSGWRASLLANLGVVYRRTGYFTKAVSAWEEAWRLSKGETEPKARAIADRAIGELAELNARLGRFETVEALLGEIEFRDIRGSATEKIAGAKQGLWLMRNKPGEAFRCGPMALDRILASTRADYRPDSKIAASQSTTRGTSLSQIRYLAQSVGLKLRMAHRETGADVPVPAMVHWKAGHFAALVKRQGGRYLAQDPTFGDEFWVSLKALDEEGTGYFLIREGALPSGWRAVDGEEGGRVWGKGAASSSNPQQITPCSVKTTGCGNACAPTRMAQYSAHAMLVSLNITDTPVGYSPPRGPSVEFLVTYNQRETFQPQVFYFSNLGAKWTFDWLSYLEDDPSNPSANAYLYVRGGGQETYSGFDTATGSYAPHLQSRGVVVRTSSAPIRYERRLPDGSVEVFNQPDGAATFPRKVFMTQSKDAQGNGLSCTYDASLRLLALTDAIGQVTTLSYDLAADPLKITRVTDPFGRFASFDYDASGHLTKITDVIGITSEFTYGAGDFVTSLTTPYGTTTFAGGTAGLVRWLQITDPVGGTERVEFQGQDATYYWDKRAWALYPGDYTKAKVISWLRTVNISVNSGVKSSERLPLENAVTYTYPGQTTATQVGTLALPKTVTRVLDDGTSQVYQYSYNARGNVCKAIDPLGRETRYTYGTNNVPDADCVTGSSIDLLNIEQKNGSNYELLQSFTYNAGHEPLTATDAAGQTTTYTYLADGRFQTEVTAPRNAPSGQPLTAAERTTTYAYYPDDAPTEAGRLQTITGPSTSQGSPISSFSYDGYGRVRTVTDLDNYTLTFDYDALDRPTKTTYPDGTYEEMAYNRLDAERRRDRLGRWSHIFYDALRRPVAIRDPLGRTVTQQWCTCGSLEKVIDSNGNPTTLERDVQGRVTREVRADNSAWELAYENTTSRLKQRKDPKSQITGYEYFLNNRRKQITYTNAQVPTPNVSFTYDPAYNRVATMTDGTGTTTYTYHPVGAPPALGAGMLASIDGPLTNDTVSYGYDELGRVASRGLSGFLSTFSYDALERLSRQAAPFGNFGYTFDGVAPRPLTLTYPNEQTTQYTYFPNSGDHRLQEITHLAPGGAVLSKHSYTHDAESQIKTWTQQTGTNPVKVYELGYDPADQLTTATVKSADPTPVTLKRYGYAYDPMGNRTSEQVGGSVLSASYNNRNQLTSRQPGGVMLFRGRVSEAATLTVQGKPAQVAADGSFAAEVQVTPGTNTITVVATDASGNVKTNTYQISVSGATTSYSYDANGDLTSDGTRTFEWDAENRLTRVLSGGSEVARFTYDGLGRRGQKTAGTVTTTYVYDAESVIEERLSSGGTLRHVHGPAIDQHWATQDGGSTVTYYLADHLGSVIQTTDAAGQVALSRDYDAYGNLLLGGGQGGYAFTGREWDPETGLYYYRARYYDAGTARFLSEDPIGLRGGINLYGYVANDPVNTRDPSGQLGWPAWGGITIVVVVTVWTLSCVRQVQTQVTQWPNPFMGPTGVTPQWTPPDPSNRVGHCIAECLITRQCPGGQATAAAAGFFQDPPWASDPDMDDRSAGGRGRSMAVTCPKGNCYDLCLEAHQNGQFY